MKFMNKTGSGVGSFPSLSGTGNLKLKALKHYSNDSCTLDDFVEIDSYESATDASSILEDESQYSAVVHFKPNKLLNDASSNISPQICIRRRPEAERLPGYVAPKKRVAPVPGLWTVAGADEFISKNKKFARDQEKESATYVWALRNRATVTKRTKATPRKATIRVPAAGKTVEDKKNEMKKESKKEMKENIPADGKDQKNGGTSMITKLFTARTRPAPEPAKEKSDEVKPEAKNVLGDKKKEAEKKEIAASPKDAKKVEPQKKAQTKTEPQKGKKSSVTGPTKKNEETTKAEKVVPMKTVAAKEQQTQMAAVIKSKSSRAEGISAVLMAPMLSLKNTKRIREKKPVVTQSVNHSFSKTPTALAAKKTLPQKK
ncbi:hypothetical protein NECAME_14145 [Necator americanus]|uniref:Uncharacterized protein n=1 Tax=Necator americanus TaxID=51031 RepID=W2SS25_NECAM|nr:hypothetical protein NECAME_14145 [Necator americanus]ETN71656.1 hypothetical protein NECAME_14145 [Necator americanus]